MSKLEKARIYSIDHPKNVFYVQFNPNSLRYMVEQDYGYKKDGEDMARKQSDATGQSGWAKLSMTLFFYTFESETEYSDVRRNINRLRPYLGRRSDRSNVLGEKIGFAWGTITLEGHLESMEVSYQMFASDGTPVQAEVQISIVGEDREVKAEGINHAKEIQLEEEAKVRWTENKDSGDPAESDMGIAWLFEGG